MSNFTRTTVLCNFYHYANVGGHIGRALLRSDPFDSRNEAEDAGKAAVADQDDDCQFYGIEEIYVPDEVL